MFCRGGSIADTKGLRHILSIGYEVECGVLAKMTGITEDDTLILLNTDTTSKDVAQLKKLEYDVDELDDNIMKRIEETVEINTIDNNGKVDKNADFHITNDYAVTPFLKLIKPLCFYTNDNSSMNSSLEESITNEKNNMYKFHANDGNVYDIHFVLNAFNKCESFSCVEWILTYYKPVKSKNVILDTFVNMMQNIVRHMNDLISIPGNLKIHFANNDFEIIGKPQERILYHKPNTNIYYLQTHVLDKPLAIDDVCSKIQMTFGTKIERVFDVTLTLLNVPDNKKIYSQHQVIQNIVSCVNELVKKSNHSIHIRAISCIGLILYKIHQYYEFIEKHGRFSDKYFKNMLFMNVRHSNYDLYMEFKKHVGNDALNVLCNIVLQPNILNKYMGQFSVRRGAFGNKDILDKKSLQYGNPSYSLYSYFQFFEHPKDDESNLGPYNNILYNDWLQYKKIDFSSAKLPLVRDVVLIEMRSFHDIITSFIKTIADDTLFEQINNGICNEITKKYGTTNAYSIRDMRKIIELCMPILSIKKSLLRTAGTRSIKQQSNYTRKNIHHRCPNGSRRNKITGNCESTKAKSGRCP